MKDAGLLRFPSGAGPSPEHLAARAVADRQLEIADLYLAAAESLDLGDRSLLRTVRSIRGEVAGVRRELNDPSRT